MSAAPQHGPAKGSARTHQLYEQYGKQIYAFCLQRLRSREEAEDAVQTTFLNAFRALQRGTVTEFQQAWLFKIAQNVCLERHQASGRRAQLESPSDLQILQETTPAHAPPDSDQLIGVEEALQRIPANQRKAILLREWQGLSYREIGDELGLSQASVEMLIFRARRSLAAALEKPELQPAKKHRRATGGRAINVGSLVTALKTFFTGGAAVKAVAVAVTAGAAVVTVSAPSHTIVRHHRDHVAAAKLAVKPVELVAYQRPAPARQVRIAPAATVLETKATRRVHPRPTRTVVFSMVQAPRPVVAHRQAARADARTVPQPAPAAPAPVAPAPEAPTTPTAAVTPTEPVSSAGTGQSKAPKPKHGPPPSPPPPPPPPPPPTPDPPPAPAPPPVPDGPVDASGTSGTPDSGGGDTGQGDGHPGDGGNGKGKGNGGGGQGNGQGDGGGGQGKGNGGGGQGNGQGDGGGQSSGGGGGNGPGDGQGSGGSGGDGGQGNGNGNGNGNGGDHGKGGGGGQGGGDGQGNGNGNGNGNGDGHGHGHGKGH